MKIVAATRAQEPILAELLELYAEDFRAFHPVEVSLNGRFVYRELPLYWTETSRYPLLIDVHGEWVGFAFVKRGSQLTGDADVWDMAEFFVVPECRRCGLGTEVAHAVWRCFPGAWEVRVMEANATARSFWLRAIMSFTGRALCTDHFEKDGAPWHLYSFDTRLAVAASRTLGA